MGLIDGLLTGPAIGAGMGLLLENHNNQQQQQQQQALTNIQTNAQKDLMTYGQGLQMQTWNDTNYEAQMKHIKDAGLNPALLYSKGGAGGATTGSSSGQATGATAAPNNGGMGMGMQMAQLALLEAQKKNIDADTANKEAQGGKATAETANVPKTGENIDADTQNKRGDTDLKAQQAAKTAAEAGTAQTQQEIAANSKFDVMNSIAAKALSDAEQLDQLYRTGQMQSETYNDNVTRIKHEAIESILKNTNTIANTENTKADTANKQNMPYIEGRRLAMEAQKISQTYTEQGIELGKQQLTKYLTEQGYDIQQQGQIIDAISKIAAFGTMKLK